VLEVAERRWSRKPPGQYNPYEVNGDLVPDMVKAGDGYRVHITGLTHDERGYPAMHAAAQRKLVERLVGKIRAHREQLVDVRADHLDGAQVVVVSYGITSRVAMPAIEQARRQGVNVGHLRLVITWPFPSALVRRLAEHVKAVLVPELNLGQIVLEVERAVAGRVPVVSLPHPGGTVHDPEAILHGLLQAAR
jgi:2-oxoglutarate ferredoxin oxidoreductase subunit alpha